MKLSEILNNSEKCMNVMCLMVVIAFAITLAIWGACRGIVIVLDSVYGNNPPNIKALEVDDVRQYKFTDTEFTDNKSSILVLIMLAISSNLFNDTSV